MKERHLSTDVQYDAQKSHQSINRYQYYRGALKYNCKQYFKHTLTLLSSRSRLKIL